MAFKTSTEDVVRFIGTVIGLVVLVLALAPPKKRRSYKRQPSKRVGNP